MRLLGQRDRATARRASRRTVADLLPAFGARNKGHFELPFTANRLLGRHDNSWHRFVFRLVVFRLWKDAGLRPSVVYPAVEPVLWPLARNQKRSQRADEDRLNRALAKVLRINDGRAPQSDDCRENE